MGSIFPFWINGLFPHVTFFFFNLSALKKNCSQQSSMYWQERDRDCYKTCPIVGNSHSHQSLSGAIHSLLIGKHDRLIMTWQTAKFHYNECWQRPSVATEYILISFNGLIVFTLKQACPSMKESFFIFIFGSSEIQTKAEKTLQNKCIKHQNPLLFPLTD